MSDNDLSDESDNDGAIPEPEDSETLPDSGERKGRGAGAPRAKLPVLVVPQQRAPDEQDDASERDTLGRKKGVPPVGPKKPASSQEIISRRVNAVFAAVVTGLQPWEIRQAVAQQQLKERRAREKAFMQAKGQGYDDARAKVESLHDVPLVWGDDAIPDRTFARYLARAKQMLDDRAPEFAKQRARMLAQAQARLDFVYAKAISNTRWYAALKSIELSVELFGLRDHAKNAALLQDVQDRAGGQEDDEHTGTRMPTDPDARATAFATLAAAAIATNPALKDQLGAILGASQPTKVMP